MKMSLSHTIGQACGSDARLATEVALGGRGPKSVALGAGTHRPRQVSAACAHLIKPQNLLRSGVVQSRRRSRVMSRREDASASIDEATETEAELIKEIKRIEVDEPELEAGAESAALTVAAATAFGAGIWAILGKAKGEGE